MTDARGGGGGGVRFIEDVFPSMRLGDVPVFSYEKLTYVTKPQSPFQHNLQSPPPFHPSPPRGLENSPAKAREIPRSASDAPQSLRRALEEQAHALGQEPLSGHLRALGGVLSLTSIRSAACAAVAGVDQGERSSPADRHGNIRAAPDAGAEHPLGTDDGEARHDDVDVADEPAVNVGEVVTRFAENTKLGSRASTQRLYVQAFRRFADGARLHSYTRSQLRGRTGKRLLVEYLNGLRERLARENGGRETRTWVWNAHAIESVWVNGIEIPWPLQKRDLGRLPPVQRRTAPRDEDIRPYAEALAREPNPHRRLFVRLLLTYGWRAVNQVGSLRWRDVRLDGHGQPVAIVAREAFKTYSPIVAHVPPAVAEDLETWRAACPSTRPEAPLLPRIRANGTVRMPVQAHGPDSVKRLWRCFQRDHGIEPSLTPVYFRHWVKRKGRLRGLDNAALAAWQGHDTKSEGGGMSAHYGTNLPEEEILEEQAAKWPDGPLGDLLPPEVRTDAGLPPEAVRIVSELLSGRCDATTAALQLSDLARKQAASGIL